MGTILERVFCQGLGALLALTVFLPLSILLLGYLVYIVVEIIRELWK